MDNICFIPARSNSTRLKNKNISPFRNGNLITNTIEQAIQCNVFKRVILSSDSEDILDMAKGYEIETHLRDDNKDQIIGVIQDAIPKLSVDEDDNFCLLLVTCPLRRCDDIVKAFDLFSENNRQYPIISVKKNEHPIQMAFKKDAGGHLEPVMPAEFSMSTRKQDHKDTYFFNDAIIIDTVKRFMDKYRPSLYGRQAIPCLMSWERSIAIDYEFQLKIAQCLGGLENGEI